MNSLISIPEAGIDYATGVTDSLPKESYFSERDIRMIIWARKAFLRKLQKDKPGIPYSKIDFERLMRSEINRHVKNKISPVMEENWEQLIKNCSRLESLYLEIYQTNFNAASRKRPVISRKQQRIAYVSKREAIRVACLDGRSLGEVELSIFAEIIWGIPPQNTNRY